MEEDELKKLWSESASFQKLEMKGSLLAEKVIRKHTLVLGSIRNRERMTILAGALMIPCLSLLIFVTPQLLGKIGIAIIVLNCAFMMVRILFLKKTTKEVSMTQDLQSFLKDSLERVRGEIKDLNTVLWWSILPFFIGTMCFYWAVAKSDLSKVIFFVLAVPFGYMLYFFNKKVVSGILKPTEMKMTKALEELSSRDSDATIS